MFSTLYARATGWLSSQHLQRRIALIALVFALPSLAIGLQYDDYLLHEQLVKGGPFAAYLFTPQGARASNEQFLEQRFAGEAPWWADEHMQTRFFRPLSSLSLWLGFAYGAPPWWMHLENCVIYAVIAWLAVVIYKQLGLTGAGLGWAALFFALDMGLATTVGWIAGRNTLLAVCFGFACIALHDRARRNGRPALQAGACLCFALSLLSGELGLCTLGYLFAYTITVDRAPPARRALAVSPYAALTGVYLAHYVASGYGTNATYVYQNVLGAPAASLLAWIESIPVWLATTATLPVAMAQVLVPGARAPIVVMSVVVLALLLPLLAARWREQPAAGVLGAGAVLSLVPLATVMPQDRLRFFVALGVYGLLGPWVVRDFDAHERVRRIAARVMWRIHGFWAPLLFVPTLFGIAVSGFAGGGSNALDAVIPRATAPITIVLNAPTWLIPWCQAATRAYHGERRPPVFMLYAGTQSLAVERRDARTLELYAARSWVTTPFERIRNVARYPFRAGDWIELAHLAVEVREVDVSGTPTRARFTFDRPLDDPGLTFRYWNRSEVATWTPPPVGTRLQLPAASAF
jgi:hypothetical protein